MCNAELERLKFCAKPSCGEGEEFAVSTSVITKRKYLDHVKGYPPRVKSSPSWPPPNPRIFPKANMYYAFNEDTNPFTRVSGFLDTVCNCLDRGEVRPHFPPPLDPFTERDPYSEEESRCQQLRTEPVCFAIFGKPRLNSMKLAKMISKFWNCVLISPECLLREEIEAKTDKGRWIKQVLRAGRSVGPEVVMNLVESRLRERDVMHRGYVVEGLPLIPNDPDLDYAAYPNPSSVRIPMTPKKKASFVPVKVGIEKSEVDGSLASELEEEMSEIAEEELLDNEEKVTSDSSTSYDLARNPFATESLHMILRDDYQWDIENQIRDMFSTWPLKPGVIIYVMCPDPDVVYRRGQFRVDPYSGNTVDVGLWETREKEKASSSGSGDVEEMIELEREFAAEQALVHEDLKKHLVTRLSDMRSNVEVQCRIFEQYALPCIERIVLAHNPQHVIRVDGRTSASRMFQVVRVKLRTLQLPRVILPQMMSGVDEHESVVGGEETPQSSVSDEFEGKDKQEAFEQQRNKGVVAPRFRWTLSKWKFTCPVALSKGQRIEGSPNHAVRFMNRVYFMSSPVAARTFVENPRPFLLPPNPKPVCKIFVYGQKQSGKTKLSEFLVQVYGGKLLDPQAIENREMDHRRNSLIQKAIDQICSEVIDEVSENLENERDKREVARIAALREWCTEAQLVAEKVLRLQKNKSAKKDHEYEKELEEMREDIANYNLTPLCTDFELCQRVVGDKDILMDFAPMELIYMEPPIRELDEYDPEVTAILLERTQEVRQESLELTVEDVSKLIVATINAAQTAPNFLGLAESGWVIDGMNANVELLENVLDKGVEVEEIVVIHEAQPYEYLIEKWRQNYRDKIAKQRLAEADSELGEEEDQERRSEISADVDKLGNAENYFEGQPSKSSTTVDSEDRERTEYIDALKQFDSTWEIMREKLLERGLRIIDVKLSVTTNVESYVKQEIDDHYRFEATVMTDEEKDREAEEANFVEASSDDEELADDEEEIPEEPLEQKDNRRLGDTGVYCPVALFKHKVLWKGKDEFSAMFMDKIYLLSSQAALNEFVNQPRDFVPCRRPIEPVPLPKVSIVGPLGSGKSTLANAISRNYGMTHIDFQKRLDQYMQERRIPLVKRRSEDDFALDDKGFPLVKEPEEDVELPEDLGDQRYNYDGATIQAFVRKYLKEGAVLPKRMLKECLTDLFEPPYRWTGLIFDNFPANSYDAEAALSNFAVPEIVVELVCSADKARSRTTSKLYKAWKIKQEERKANENVRFAIEMEKVTKLREKWVSKMLKARRRLRRNNFMIDPENDQDDESGDDGEMEDQISTSDAEVDSMGDPYGSSDSSDSETGKTQAEIDRAELQEKSLARYKDPVKFENWEHPATVRERIRREVDEDYESSSQKLAAAKSVFEKESIPWIEVDAEKSETEVLMTVLNILDPYVFRNASFLERVQVVDTETAEKLVDIGYYFLSSFGKFCPVQMFENKIPFQMFLPLEAAHQIYPVLHRQYIYFLAGKERLTAFLEHPLKYLSQDSSTPLIPAKIAVIGPPKCGKTTIASRFARTYGMKVITRGQALRHTLKNFSWTELATLTNAHLRGGHTALDESIVRSVELDSIDPRGVSQGYILDGFPENQPEAEELAFLGIQPMIVIDLQADLDFCLRCLATDFNTRTKPPSFSPCYLSHQYEEWQTGAADYRCWLKKYSQNVVTLDATAQKLAVWIRADREVCRRFASIKKYFREADYDMAHSLTHLCVSLYEFRERQSQYESYCPVCLGRDNVLTFSGTPPNHEGMVQFRSHYYWVCDAHLPTFLANASTVLSSMQDVVLPQSRPEIVDEEIDVNHACWAKRLKASGFCPVTYIDSLPDRRVVPGLSTLGVMFQENLYLFCSTKCREKFITQPTKYADVLINFTHTLPPVNISTLPNLGFLEQTVADLVVRAVNEVSAMRVKLPGMTPEVTAAVYIGVYLKIYNTESELDEISVYEETLRRMNARRHLLQVAVRNAKKMINPHVTIPAEDKLPKRRFRTVYPQPASSLGSQQFRRKSPTQFFTMEQIKRMSSLKNFSV